MVGDAKRSQEDPEGYKSTDIGPVPEDWAVTTLGDLAGSGDLLLRNGFPQGSHNESGDGVPHLRPFNVTEDGNMSLAQVKYIQPPPKDSVHWLQQGDVIFNNTNSEDLVGKTACLPLLGSYVLSNHMTSIRVLAQDTVDPRWLARDLHYLWHVGLFRALCRRHVNQASVSLERLKGVVIPLPPIDEQQAIAHVLSTIQRAIEATDRVIAAAHEFKRSLMRYLFTYGPVPVSEAEHAPQKETEIGPMPEHWSVAEVNSIGEIITGTTPRTARAEYYDGPYPFIAPGDIGEARYVRKTQKHLSSKGLAVSRELPADAVLVVCIGATIGKTAMTTAAKSATNQQINAVIPNDKALCQYLYDALTCRSPHLPSLAGRAAVPIVNKSNFGGFLIPLPSLSEQRDIAYALQATDREIEAEEKRKAALKELFRTMLHLLMTGQVRVKDLEIARGQA